LLDIKKKKKSLTHFPASKTAYYIVGAVHLDWKLLPNCSSQDVCSI